MRVDENTREMAVKPEQELNQHSTILVKFLGGLSSRVVKRKWELVFKGHQTSGIPSLLSTSFDPARNKEPVDSFGISTSLAKYLFINFPTSSQDT